WFVHQGWNLRTGKALEHPSAVLHILVLGLLLAIEPNLPSYAGLVMLPWLAVLAPARVRLVGAWWLIMAVLSPFYHPYARLWLPMQAVGWILLGGLIQMEFVRLGTSFHPMATCCAPFVPGKAGTRGRLALNSWTAFAWIVIVGQATRT